MKVPLPEKLTSFGDTLMEIRKIVLKLNEVIDYLEKRDTKFQNQKKRFVDNFGRGLED